uniref:(northern house mosquito) hypothetical protein n=1 Tax=Culex pipiens TaxID=7175 RepID=A0A8D7ZSJ6_CULPI
MRLDTSLNSSAASLLPAITESTTRNDEAVVLRSDSLRSLPTIRVSSPPQLPAALVRSPSRVASVANPGVAGISRRRRLPSALPTIVRSRPVTIQPRSPEDLPPPSPESVPELFEEEGDEGSAGEVTSVQRVRPLCALLLFVCFFLLVDLCV